MTRDKATDILVEALKLAAAEPGEQRLYKSGKLEGLFASRSGQSAEAAARADPERCRVHGEDGLAVYEKKVGRASQYTVVVGPETVLVSASRELVVAAAKVVWYWPAARCHRAHPGTATGGTRPAGRPGPARHGPGRYRHLPPAARGPRPDRPA